MFLEVPFVAFFLALYTERKRFGWMGPTPCYSQSQIMSACQVLGLYLLSFFLAKYHFWLFFIQKGG